MKHIKLTPIQIFPVIIGTLSLGLSFFVLSQVFNIHIFYELGEIIFFLVLIVYIFNIILSIFFYSQKKNRNSRLFSNPASLSLMSFAGVIYYALVFFYYTYIGLNQFSIELISWLFFAVWTFMFVINIRLNYLIYNGKIRMDDVTYLLNIPSIVMGGGIIMTSVLIPSPLFPYGNQILFYLYFATVVGFGISLIQFFLVSSASLTSHFINIQRGGKKGTTMIPLGAASIIVFNLLLLPTFNKLGIFIFPTHIFFDLAILFWSFEVLILITGAFTVINSRYEEHDITVWAYVFPVGVSIFSDFLLYLETYYMIFKIDIIISSILLFFLYGFSLYQSFFKNNSASG